MSTNSIGQINNNPQGPSYGALKDDLNLDPKEAAARATQGAKDSWVGGVATGLAKPKERDLKRTILCALGTAAMVFGISYLGKNTKMFKQVGDFGDNLWNSVSKNKTAASFGKKVSDFFGGIKKGLTKPGSTGEKIANKFKAIYGKNANGTSNVLRPKNSFARPMIFGTKWEVVDNVTDQLQAMLRPHEIQANGPIGRFFKPVRQLWRNAMEGSGFFKSWKTADAAAFKAGNKAKFEKMLTDNGCKDVKGLCDRLINLSGDVDEKFAVYKEVRKYLKAEDIASTKELLTGRVHGFKVGLFDSVRRAELINNAGDGKALYGAKTKLGRIFQKGLFRGMEAPSNGVASRGVMPFGIALPIYWGVFNKVSDAKKGEKVSKFAEETVSDMGNYMMIPITAGTMYAAASMKYLGANATQIKTYKDAVKSAHGAYAAAKGNKAGQDAAINMFKNAKNTFNQTGNGFERLLRKPGQLLGMGLEGKPGSKLTGKAGGAMRLMLYMFALAPLFIKPVKNLCYGIFGKPSDTKAEEDQKKQEKLDKKQTKENQLAFMKKLRELGITQEDLTNQLMQRPDLVQRLQTDEQLAQNFAKNPLILFDLLASPVTPAVVAPVTQGRVAISPALTERLNTGNTSQATTPATAIPAPTPTLAQAPIQTPVPTPVVQTAAPNTIPVAAANPTTVNPAANPPRSYIPSSAPITQGSNLTPDQQVKLDKLYVNADRAEAEAMKYL